MRPIVIFLLLVITTFTTYAQTDSLRHVLEDVLGNRSAWVSQKESRIESYKTALQHTPVHSHFDLYQKIYEEYKTFIYDSAFTYARRMQQDANLQQDESHIAIAKVKLGFILLSSGMFNEALDTLHSVVVRNLDTTNRADYYSVIARTYYDLVDFNRDQHFTNVYTALGNQYVDSALMLTDPKAVDYLALRSMKYLRMEKIDSAQADLERMIKEYPLTDPQWGIAASTLGYIYQRKQAFDKAENMLMIAAIADNRSSTKETIALLNLAELLYSRNDVTRAYDYVKLAMDDANFYGARHRKIQVAAIFPIIEGNKLSTVERQRKQIFTYATVVTILILLTIMFMVVIYRQYKKLKAADESIHRANESLREANTLLRQVNENLMEANKIKEEYIGYYFNINSEYLVKIQAFKQAVDNKLMAKKYDEIRLVVNNINLKKEREELYTSFDKVFLKLFPGFVETFNSLFPEEDRMVLKDGQLLNTELRIFALIRMGIQDPEKIAKILDYSIHTIYNYKARIKSKSLVPNDQFEERIMQIQAI
jgi:predicted negative regulator of RcsB-dependent stress response